jgi:hypothetical protein
MSKPKNTAKLVITSIITSIVVVAIIALVFVKFIVPIYNITEDRIYSVLIALFPLLIGFALIQIGVIAGKKNEDDYKDQVDKLPPNAYSDPLMQQPADDPNNPVQAEKEMSLRPEYVEKKVEVETPVVNEVVKEVVKPIPVETIREIPVEVVKLRNDVREVQVVKEVPVEKIVYRDREVPVEIPVIKEVVKEVPVEVIKEVIKEVPVEVIKEVIKEVPVEVIKEVVKEVPVEVEKEVIKEVPVEVEKEVVREVPVAQAEAEPVEETDLTAEQVLDEEFKSAENDAYDLSALYAQGDSNLSEDALTALIGEDYIFPYKLGYLVILPFNDAKESEKISARIKTAFPEAVVTVTTKANGSTPEKMLKAIA